MNPTILIILTMAFGSVLLVVVAGATAVLAVVNNRQANRLQRVESYHDSIKRISADLAALRKEHLALDELVSVWMNRNATRSKREKKEKEREEEPSTVDNAGLFFPSEYN